VPEIVGATFERETTRTEKPGNVTVFVPSLTEILMPVHKPTTEDLPLILPVVVLNDAQAGLFAIEKLRVLPSGSFAVGRNA
jgi:hypothetical protein